MNTGKTLFISGISGQFGRKRVVFLLNTKGGRAEPAARPCSIEG